VLFYKIAFGSSSANADGSELWDVAVSGGKLRHLGGVVWHRPRTIVFSPDKRNLLLVEGGIRFFVENKRLVRIEYASGRRTTLTGNKVAAIEPAWSADNRRIAYISAPDTHRVIDSDDITKRWSTMYLWVMSSEGSGKRQLTSDSHFRESNPRWLSGTQIEFERDDNADISPNVKWQSRRSLWSIRSDGSNLKKIRELPPAKSD